MALKACGGSMMVFMTYLNSSRNIPVDLNGSLLLRALTLVKHSKPITSLHIQNKCSRNTTLDKPRQKGTVPSVLNRMGSTEH
nr:unnamed protein product [Callosobruchus chinensis]